MDVHPDITSVMAESMTADSGAERVSGIEPRAIEEPAPGAGPDDREAQVRALVANHYDFIWRSLRRVGLNDADADDAAQEVFVVAARKLEQIAAGKARSFLFGTALRVASTHRRADARRRERPAAEMGEHGDDAPGPEQIVERRRARALLDQVLDEIEMDSRTVFVLFELEELPTSEIAELLGVPVGTVASRLRRAREAFQAAIKRLHARQAFKGEQP